jgi:hypothetical protein
MRRARRLPRPLAALLAIGAILATAWSTVLPALQGPDEGGHYTYTEKIVETGVVPWTVLRPERSGTRSMSSEQSTAGRWAGLEPLRGNISARPFWTEADEELWRRQARSLPAGARADAQFTSSFDNPPLYYLAAAVPYAAGRAGDFFDRFWLMRAMNIPLLVACIGLTWILAGRLLGPRMLPRVVATALVALQPQLTQLGGTITPDVLLTLLVTAGLLVAVGIAQDELTARRALVLAALVVAAGLTQPRGLALAGPATIAVVVSLQRRLGLGRAALGWSGAVGALAAGAVVAAAVGPEPARIREFVSYVWQFYGPRLPFMEPAIGPPDYDVRHVAVDRLWGAFAQLEVLVPPRLATALWLATCVFGAGTLVLAVHRRRALRARWRVWMTVAAAPVATALLVHVVAYRAMLADPGDPVVAGRYVLPVLPVAGVALGALVGALPRELRPAMAGSLVGAFVVLQLTALGLTADRFYG